ncbi:MAG: glycoside hydrolase family 16 protein [Aeromicrobium erythreum]
MPERRRRRVVGTALAALLALCGCADRPERPGRPAPAATTASACTVPDLTDPAHGRLVWHDEFDGDRVDRSRWNVRDGDKLSFDQAAIEAANVGVADGRLAITARREEVRGRPFTTGYLDTIGRFAQRYGRWEARVRLPVAPGRSRGLWPAFWLRATETAGEIDVVEAWGTPVRPGRRLPGAASWTVHEDTTSPPGSRSVGGWVAPQRLDGDFHVFAVDRTPDCLRFSLDGRTTGTVRVADHPWVREALDSPLAIRLNLQVGGAYWGRADDGTALPAALLVDHVRAYAPVGGPS